LGVNVGPELAMDVFCSSLSYKENNSKYITICISKTRLVHKESVLQIPKLTLSPNHPPNPPPGNG
jgi:hypothetical protein